MGKYEQLAKDIIKNVGGKENVDSLTHCVTRLRFQLKDESIAHDDVLKKMEGVVTVMHSAGQYQVVIGNHVPDVYKDVCEVAGISGEASTGGHKKMSPGAAILDFISGSMMPSIGILCACGMIKGFNTILLVAGILSDKSGMYTLLNAIGDTIFFFFPVFIAMNAAEKLGMNKFLGLAMGGALCYPAINGVPIELFGFTVNATYTSTVLPPMLLVLFAAPINKWLNKVIPDVVKTFLVPMFTLLICVPIGFAIIGPAANLLGVGITWLFNAAYNLSPVIAGAFMGAAWQIFVMFGVHFVVLMGPMMNLMAGNPDPVMTLMIPVSFAQTAVVFAIWLKTKNKKLKDIALPAWISGIFGVTEPAIYGVTLPRVKYFVISCIGGAIGSMILGFFNVVQINMAGMGIFAFPGFVDPSNSSNIVITIVSCIIAMVFSFVATYMIYKDEGDDAELPEKVEEKKLENEEVLSPLNGQVKPLSEAADQAFAEGLLGKGVVIVPSDGKVVAPVDGTVVTLFPTKHAIGLKSDKGCEVLIHLGIDTVKLEGKYFTSHVEQGAHVNKGDLLVTFDVDAIAKEGYVTETPIIITNSNDYLDIVETQETSVHAGDKIIDALV